MVRCDGQSGRLTSAEVQHTWPSVSATSEMRAICTGGGHAIASTQPEAVLEDESLFVSGVRTCTREEREITTTAAALFRRLA